MHNELTEGTKKEKRKRIWRKKKFARKFSFFLCVTRKEILFGFYVAHLMGFWVFDLNVNPSNTLATRTKEENGMRTYH